MTKRIVLLLMALAALAAAQQSSTNSSHVGDYQATIVAGSPRAKPIVTGAPYSADQMQDYVPKPGDNTRPPTSSVIGHFYRDAEGRSRMERAQKPTPIWIVEISDPVAGYAYVLDEQNKIAHRRPLPPDSGARTPPPMPGTAESLGTQTIEGVEARGTRYTGPLTLEIWVSEELHETLVTKSSNGYTSRLVNLSRAEPDAALFRAPADYAVVDDPANSR